MPYNSFIMKTGALYHFGSLSPELDSERRQKPHLYQGFDRILRNWLLMIARLAPSIFLKFLSLDHKPIFREINRLD